MPNDELNIPSYKEVLQLIARKAYEGLTKKADLPENYPKKLTEETRRKVEEIMLSAQSGGILKEMVVPSLLAGLLKKQKLPGLGFKGELAYWSTIRPEQKKNLAAMMKEVMSTPQKELSRIKEIKWTGSPASTERGRYVSTLEEAQGTPRIEYNPFQANLRTVAHEFVHARHYKPEAEESVIALGLREANQRVWTKIMDNFRAQRFTRSGPTYEQAWNDFYWNISQTEAMARDISKVPMRKFGGVYEQELPKYSKMAEDWLDTIVGEGATRKMWEEIIERGR